jgi:hypothetical protein
MISKEQLKAKLDQPKINELKNGGNPFKNVNKSMPTTTQMAKNLGNSLVRNIQSVAAGNPLKISDSDANFRLNICKGCEFFNSDSQRCTKCGCHMAVKTYLKAEKCPVGKW